MSTDRPTTDAEALRLEHLPVWEAIPWVVNGRATPSQASLVAGHVAQCEDCRAELDLQRQLQAALEASPVPDGASPEPQAEGAEEAEVEAGLQRLLARLDDAPEQPQPRYASATPGRRLTLALAAAVVVQAVGLGVLGLRLVPADPAAPPAVYGTLSESTPPAHATLRVLPEATMTLAEWQAMLQALGLQVVQGPNAAGAYALAPAPGTAPRAPAEAVARLRATPGIRLAEQIGPGS
ncbi:MAG TPA: hypothetical protein VGQ91_05340 [Ideonella sp.]|jgi:hypothetical protein|nr:hypothetical protein [Ideonella sp.]